MNSVDLGTSVTTRRDGVALHARIRGAGEPLVLVHGLGACADLWVHQIPALGATRRLICVDLRGFGRSDRPRQPGAYEIGEMARDVAAICATLGVTRTDVLGTSMGGFVAQSLALAEPRLCRSLVLCHTAAKLSIPADILATRLATLRRETMAAYAELVAGQALAPDPDPDLRRWLTDMLAANDPGAYEQVLTEGLANFDLTDHVAVLAMPVLVIVGEQDRVIPAAEGRVLAGLIRQAELVELEGVGHIGYAERPGAFNAAVTRFLDRLAATTNR